MLPSRVPSKVYGFLTSAIFLRELFTVLRRSEGNNFVGVDICDASFVDLPFLEFSLCQAFDDLVLR